MAFYWYKNSLTSSSSMENLHAVTGTVRYPGVCLTPWIRWKSTGDFFYLFCVKFVSFFVWPRQTLMNTDSTYSEFPSLFFPSDLCKTSLDVGSLTCCLGFFRSTSASLEIPELLFTAQKYLPNKLMSDVTITKFGNFGDCSNCWIPFKVGLKSTVCLFLLQISGQDYILGGLC